MRIIESYACGICNQIYPREALALECEAQGMPKKTVKVGDIVLAKSGFGWYAGDKRWITNPKVLPEGRRSPCPKTKDTNCFSRCCLYEFYYVVTHIDIAVDSIHRIRYHLATKAMTDKTGYDHGYTHDEGHYEPILVKKPPQYVVKTSKDLLGNKSDRLL